MAPDRGDSRQAAELDTTALQQLIQDAALDEAGLAVTVQRLARQALDDGRGLLPVAELAVARAVEQGWTSVEMHARLLCAELDRTRGEIVAATRGTRAVIAWATEQGDHSLLAQGHRVMAWILRSIGDRHQALDNAVLSVIRLPAGSPFWIRATHLMTLGIELSINGSPDCDAHLAEAYELAVRADDTALAMSVLNNRAYAQFVIGRPENGYPWITELLALAERTGQPLALEYRDTVARFALEAGDHERVAALLTPMFDDPESAPYVENEALPECMLTYAESCRALGDLGQAEQILERALVAALQRRARRIEGCIRRELAAVLAERGDHRTAYQQLLAHLDAMDKAQDDTRQVQDAVALAVHEMDQARRARDEFRELAWRDPLTGLMNRRHLDEQVPQLLERLAATGTPFSLALIDLDHFKQINDTWSHPVGDEVLRQVASMLGQVIPESASVARIGGEEFVVLMPGLTADAATALGWKIRDAVRAHDWTALVGAHRVTLSIGVVTARPSDEQRTMLERADRRLYRAKASGRDQVCGDRGDDEAAVVAPIPPVAGALGTAPIPRRWRSQA